MEESAKIEEIPDNAPWKLDWRTVATEAGSYKPVVNKELTYSEQVTKDNIKPWLIDWGRYRKEQPKTPAMAPSSFLKETVIPAQGRAKQTAPAASDGGYNFESVVRNLIQTESKGRHTDKEGKLTTSPVGAKGITQVMRKTGEDPGYGVAPLKDESENEYIRFGRDYLRAMLNEFGGDYRKALAAYNYGPGSVKKAISASRRSGEDWLSHTPAETKNYVSKILGEGMSKISREGNGVYDIQGEPVRGSFDKLPYIETKTLLSSGLLTKAGRDAYEKKWKDEHADKLKRMTPKQRDSFFTEWPAYAKKNDPEKFGAYSMLKDQNSDMPVSVQSYLEQANPKIVFTGVSGRERGFVFNGSGDRVFLNLSADFNTLVHETEHLQQQGDFKKFGTSIHGDRFAKMTPFSKERTPLSNLMDVVISNRDEPAFKSVWRASNSIENRSEFMANFVGYMKNMKEGDSWSNTPFYNKLIEKVGKEEAQAMLIDIITTAARSNIEKKDSK